MNDFEFYSPTKFVFGKGVTDQTGTHLKAAGFTNTLVVYGQGSVVKNGTLERVLASLDKQGINHTERGGVRPNPEVGWVREAIAFARASKIDSVLAIGGGSVIDAAKAIGFGVPYEGDVWDFFAKKSTIESCLPLASVLTIPAAGSEASSSCVISNDELGLKTGTNSDIFRPCLAIMDPELTYTLPAYQTAAGVTDMIAHVCERYFSGQPDVPITDNIALGIINALIDAAPIALNDPSNYDARANIMWAGTLAHNDLAGCGRSASPTARAGGWESHGLEHELSAHHPEITHGAGLAVIMPAWMRYVWKADPARFLAFGYELFGIEAADSSEEAVAATVEAIIDELQDFFAWMGMPTSLADFGLAEADIDELLPTLERNKGASFGGFTTLTLEDARAIYVSAL